MVSIFHLKEINVTYHCFLLQFSLGQCLVYIYVYMVVYVTAAVYYILATGQIQSKQHSCVPRCNGSIVR